MASSKDFSFVIGGKGSFVEEIPTKIRWIEIACYSFAIFWQNWAKRENLEVMDVVSSFSLLQKKNLKNKKDWP